MKTTTRGFAGLVRDRAMHLQRLCVGSSSWISTLDFYPRTLTHPFMNSADTSCLPDRTCGPGARRQQYSDLTRGKALFTHAPAPLRYTLKYNHTSVPEPRDFGHAHLGQTGVN